MSHRSLKQIQEGLRRKLSELYEVPIHDIMPGAELDPKKVTQQLRRSPGLYASPDLPQNAAGVAYAAGRVGSKQSGRVEPTLGTPPSASTPSRPSDVPKAQWRKMSPIEKQSRANQSPTVTALPPKPFLQSKDKYISGLTDKQLDRYNREQVARQANKMGVGTKVAIGTGATAATVAGIGALPDNKEKTDTTTTPAVDTQPPAPVDTATTPTSADTAAANPEPTQDNTGTQAGLPVEEPKADIETPATSVKSPPPLQAYPPGTKFSDDLLEKETYSRVLNKYKNFLYEETEQQRRDAERLQAIQRGIYGQESGSGKAKTDKPNYAGALGPMQIMPGTFKWMKDAKIIPQDFDIKNPEQNRAAGNALISHYYTKYQGDPAKVAAAYYAGPGAIKKDGTINTHWRDRKNPKAPDVGQYINQTLKKAGIADATYLASKPSVTPVAVVSTVEPVTPSPEPVVTVAKADTRPTTSAPFDSSKFDYDAFYKAVDTGQDWSDFSKFQKSSAPAKASVSERYERFKTATR